MAYCDVTYADTYLSAGAFAAKWSALDAVTKGKYLEQSTRFIKTYTIFYDESGTPFKYNENALGQEIPDWLKNATSEEALYLVGLGKDPTVADKKLTLGIRSTEGTVFDKGFQAAILGPVCVQIIEKNGGEVESGAVASGGASWQYINK